MKKYIRLVVAFIIAALPISILVAQNTKDWYAPQSITVLDKASYKKVFNAFKKKDCISLAFHFEKCRWSCLRYNSEYGKLLEDSTYLNDLLLDFEDAVVKEAGIEKCGEKDSTYLQNEFTLHVLIKNVTKDAGIDASGLIVYHDSIPFCRIDLSVKDGRWNNFPTLFVENGEEMGHKMKKLVRGMQSELYLYKKDLLIKKGK